MCVYVCQLKITCVFTIFMIIMSNVTTCLLECMWHLPWITQHEQTYSHMPVSFFPPNDFCQIQCSFDGPLLFKKLLLFLSQWPWFIWEIEDMPFGGKSCFVGHTCDRVMVLSWKRDNPRGVGCRPCMNGFCTCPNFLLQKSSIVILIQFFNSQVLQQSPLWKILMSHKNHVLIIEKALTR